MRRVLLILAVTFLGPTTFADEPAKPESPQAIHRVTGLFTPDRVADLRMVFAKQPQIELIDVDFERAEATFRYDPKMAFAGTPPEKIIERFNENLGHWSRGTFGIKPRCAIADTELERTEIGVVGHDCKGCNLAAYEAVFKIEGVERATASFGDGKVVVWHERGKVSREQIETALKAKQVRLMDAKP